MRTAASEMTDSGSPAWADEDEQDVRPYAVTGGRTRPRHTMRLVSLLVAGHALPPGALVPEAEATAVFPGTGMVKGGLSEVLKL